MHYLTCKQAASAWGISPTKATQAGDPAFLKVAQAIVQFPEEAHLEIAHWIARAKQMQFEAELPARELMLANRFTPEK